jgi:hypothetical protein
VPFVDLLLGSDIKIFLYTNLKDFKLNISIFALIDVQNIY